MKVAASKLVFPRWQFGVSIGFEGSPRTYVVARLLCGRFALYMQVSFHFGRNQV